MKKLWAVFLIIFTLIIFQSCKKNDSSQNNNNNNKPEPTPVGTPTGTKTSKLIPTSGGKISSSDGLLEVDFPSGALSIDQTISIQPITNNCPGGIGLAYRLEPDGTKFNKPVTLAFHYADSVLETTLPEFMFLSYQDTTGIWFLLDNVKNDTINHILSGNTLHFTDWTCLPEVQIIPKSATLKTGKKTLEIDVFVAATQEIIDFFGVHQYAIIGSPDPIWAVNGVTNGNDQYGTIEALHNSPSPSPNQPPGRVTHRAKYTSPDHLPPAGKNPVLASAEFNQIFLADDINDHTIVVNKVILYSLIRIIDGGYHVELSFRADSVSVGGALWELRDKGSFDIELAGESGSVTNIQNDVISINLFKDEGNCNPEVSYYGTWPIHIIDSGQVILNLNPVINSVSVIFNSIEQRNWIKAPVWNYSCPGGDSGQLGGGLGPPFPSIVTFKKNDSTQTFFVADQYKIVVSPLK